MVPPTRDHPRRIPRKTDQPSAKNQQSLGRKKKKKTPPPPPPPSKKAAESDSSFGATSRSSRDDDDDEEDFLQKTPMKTPKKSLRKSPMSKKAYDSKCKDYWRYAFGNSGKKIFNMKWPPADAAYHKDYKISMDTASASYKDFIKIIKVKATKDGYDMVE